MRTEVWTQTSTWWLTASVSSAPGDLVFYSGLLSTTHMCTCMGQNCRLHGGKISTCHSYSYLWYMFMHNKKRNDIFIYVNVHSYTPMYVIKIDKGNGWHYKAKSKGRFLCKELCCQGSIMVLFESEFSLFRVNIVNSRIKHRPCTRREDGSTQVLSWNATRHKRAKTK